MKDIHDLYESGRKEYPIHLVPSFPSEQCQCKHGNSLDTGDLVRNKLVLNKGTVIYKSSVTINDQERSVYYRPTQKGCSCRLGYDGQEDLLFNLDNHHIFSYSFLFQYLHNMVEGKNPLVSYLQSYERTFASLSNTKPFKIKPFRHAWLAFIRLLDIQWSESFHNILCGSYPKAVICDGSVLGFSKDLLEAFPANHLEHTATISGSKHADRILIKSPQTRKILLHFTG